MPVIAARIRRAASDGTVRVGSGCIPLITRRFLQVTPSDAEYDIPELHVSASEAARVSVYRVLYGLRRVVGRVGGAGRAGRAGRRGRMTASRVANSGERDYRPPVDAAVVEWGRAVRAAPGAAEA